jgi:ABC-type transport system involved in multi-copper enzyme maturation permease subunit
MTGIDAIPSPGPGRSYQQAGRESQRRRALLGDVIRSEWVKLASTPSLLWPVIVMGLAVPVLSVVVAATGSIQPDDTILGGSLTGAAIGQVIAGAVGALTVTGEHASGTIRTTLVAMPRRTVVFTAKAVVVAAATVPTALAAGTAAFLIGVAMLGGAGRVTGHPWPAVLGFALAIGFAGLLGLAIGSVLRHSAGAVAAVVGLVVVPSLFGPLFGGLQPWIVGASPSVTLQKLAQSSDAAPELVGSLGGWASLAVMAIYTAVALAAAGRIFDRRDV